jgi:hypothetical protein
MPVIGEIRGAVAMLAEGVGQLRTLVDAMNDGRAYLRSKHPDAEPDVARLLRQMNVTISGLINTAETITSINFTLDGTGRDAAPSVFNEELKRAAQQRDDHVTNLRYLSGSCKRMEEIRLELQSRADNKPMWALFGDRSGQRAQELADTFRELFLWDQKMDQKARQVLDASKHALEQVQETLRPRPKVAGMSVEMVDAAAELLWEQQQVLRPQVANLKELRDEVANLIDELDPKGATADEQGRHR